MMMVDGRMSPDCAAVTAPAAAVIVLLCIGRTRSSSSSIASLLLLLLLMLLASIVYFTSTLLAGPAARPEGRQAGRSISKCRAKNGRRFAVFWQRETLLGDRRRTVMVTTGPAGLVHIVMDATGSSPPAVATRFRRVQRWRTSRLSIEIGTLRASHRLGHIIDTQEITSSAVQKGPSQKRNSFRWIDNG
jgi:hypothetical protein